MKVSYRDSWGRRLCTLDQCLCARVDGVRNASFRFTRAASDLCRRDSSDRAAALLALFCPHTERTTSRACFAQTDKTVTFDGGDVYTGQLDADGRRQGKGCCDYGAASGKAAGEEAMTQSSADGGDGGGGGDGSYSGEWDADEPHGYGERVYPHSREGEGKERGGGGADMATMTAAFGHGCPPLASYRGDFRRGVREGKGVCSFFAPDPVRNAARSASTSRTTSLVDPIPESYDGEWVDGRPMGRGVLTLRRTAAATVAPSSGPYPSSVPGSGSMMMTTRDGTSHGGSSDDGGGGSGGGGRNGSGGSIEGMWTEEGLVHGKEKLPGKGGVYEGQYRLGRREGQGRLELPDGSEYEGETHRSKIPLVISMIWSIPRKAQGRLDKDDKSGGGTRR